MIWPVRKPENDVNTILAYSKGSPERERLLVEIEKIKSNTSNIPLIIDGKEIFNSNTVDIKSPHNHDLVLAKACLANEAELKLAIDSSLNAHEEWANLDWYHRAAVFEKAADVLAGPKRIENIASIMLNQSKTPYEAEIDLAELVDFWRYNAYFMRNIYEKQPEQYPIEMNRFDWRPLEGFIVAIPPFNFYSIGGNLPTAPALMGNVALWKPATSVIPANYEIMKILLDSGLPAGVINFVPFNHKEGRILFQHRDFAGLHFTGGYSTLVSIWKEINGNVDRYKNFPRIVGETGGKDFIFVHPSAETLNVAMNIIRGGFEYQGQKCSACSRVYMPISKWPAIKEILLREIPKIKYGPTETLENYMGSVISEKSFNNISSYLNFAKEHPEEYEFLIGGNVDGSKGWFVEPTIVVTKTPKSKLISEEIFGPVVTVYLYEDKDYLSTLKLCDETSPYALTGAVFAEDKYAISQAERILRYSAGNFYINDKPTGAVVSRQPFGGARASGTNDKAGSWLNLLRWVSPRTMKETTIRATDWRRPFLL